MASNTNNLGLLKKDPVADGNDTFNVRTMLNENWDKIDAAIGDVATPAAAMGLTKHTVGDALNVLANVGNLHVWERVQTYAEPVPEVPAGYTLGEVVTGKFQVASYNSNNSDSARGCAVYYVWDDLTLTYDGEPDLSAATEKTVYGGGDYYTSVLLGKFILLKEIRGYNCTVSVPLNGNEVLFIPSDAVLTHSANDYESGDDNMYRTWVDRYQPVSTYPYTPAIPAGTSTDYLTSTDRNAYPDQSAEGGQDAYYTLGDVVSGYLFASAWDGNASNYYYSETIQVSDTGTLTQENVKRYTANATNNSWVSGIQSAIRGKFITVSGETNNGGSKGTNLVYIPADAIVSYFENGVSLGYPYNYGFLVNKMQHVTGHAAIPANTTITYLGQLGGGARIEVGSYVGTGTYGSSNPNTLTFGFEPKLLIIRNAGSSKEYLFLSAVKSGRYVSFSLSGSGSSVGSYTGVITLSGNIVSWYADNSQAQMNLSDNTFHYIALG